MTNFQRWQNLMRDVTSPQVFIDFGFYYMISSALQRRVWTNADHQKLYPNVYVILVAPPGIGKGLVIKPLLEILRHHRILPPGSKPIEVSNAGITEAVLQAADYGTNNAQNNGTKRPPPPRLVIPVAANSITYEALVNTCSDSTRRINFLRFDEKMQKDTPDIYTHASLCFCLEEISSLLHKDAEKVVNFLITAYDCGDYHYKTKTQGEDYVKRCCLNFMGGTTPNFIESSFNDKLLTEGFSSRVWFIYAPRPRFARLRTPELDDNQKADKEILIEHVRKLTKLHGFIPFSKEADAWLKQWWEVECQKAEYRRPNLSEKLDSYYSRKNMHVQKMAMIIHFSENAQCTEEGRDPKPVGEISLAETQQAISILEEAEKSMHLALNFDGDNPLHKISKKILQYIKKNPGRSTDELEVEFFTDVKSEELKEIVEHLQRTSQIYLDDKVLRWFARTKESSKT